MSFKLTYSTMFDPPPELHDRFESALASVRKEFGRSYGHYFDGKDLSHGELACKRSGTGACMPATADFLP